MEQSQVDWKALPDGFILFLVVLTYVIVLLVFAHFADRRTPKPGRNLLRGIGYALSLSVLSTSWTYLGAVGVAIRNGWDFLPNSLGPIIALTLLFPIWTRIARKAQRGNVNSIADFISTQYGKSRSLGALIACVSIVGALPYIALQITALSKSAGIIVGARNSEFSAPLVVCALAGLAIVLGARRPTLTQHNRGLTRIIALESIVKLGALLIVAFLSIAVISRIPVSIETGSLGDLPQLSPSFIISTMLCTVTVFTLPRVFHLGFVTLEDPTDLRIGRIIFPLYMALWALAIIPIAVAGMTLGIAEGDTAVLRLPMAFGGPVVTNIAFLGAFSAGSAMVIVEAIALSAMISNELILPWLAGVRRETPIDRNVGSIIVNVRRAAIVAILLLSYLYFRALSADSDLARLGFSSLAASAQFAPALIGGLFWNRGHAAGAFWGIMCGMAIWCWAIVAPQLGGSPVPFTFDLIPDPFDLAVCLSLGANLAIYFGVSLLCGIAATEKKVSLRWSAGQNKDGEQFPPPMKLTIGELRNLLKRFLGPSDAAQGLADFDRQHGRPFDDDQTVTPIVARIAEKMLAGAVGASSARNVIGLALAGRGGRIDDFGKMLDDAAEAVQFSREILGAALNGIDHGICVVDHDLRIVAWNHRYPEIFDFPPQELYVGRLLQDLVEHHADRQGLTGSERADFLEERLGPVRRREAHQFEKEWPNDRIIRTVGRPLAGGEYVSSFSDITEVRRAEYAMLTINEELEQRVRDRTKELTEANAALAAANDLAQRVVAAQDRFVAAASHDLLQPLHAARLYLGSALSDVHPGTRAQVSVERADLLIESADRLLNALLNLSRIEIGGITPEVGPLSLDSLLLTLRDEFAPLARSKGLELHLIRRNAWVESNADLLRSVLQNLISNAIRYTESGRILIAVRTDGEDLRVEIRDTGPGVPVAAQKIIFNEFQRLDRNSPNRAGAGLGLAIAQRICNALGHRIKVRSKLGQGSVFSVKLRRSVASPNLPPSSLHRAPLTGMTILCVEDEPDVRKAQTMLLERWGAVVVEATNGAEARALNQSFDVILADYHLGEGVNGATVIAELGPMARLSILLSSDVTEEVRCQANLLGVSLLRKPVAPGALRAILTEAARLETA